MLYWIFCYLIPCIDTTKGFVLQHSLPAMSFVPHNMDTETVHMMHHVIVLIQCPESHQHCGSILSTWSVFFSHYSTLYSSYIDGMAYLTAPFLACDRLTVPSWHDLHAQKKQPISTCHLLRSRSLMSGDTNRDWWHWRHGKVFHSIPHGVLPDYFTVSISNNACEWSGYCVLSLASSL